MRSRPLMLPGKRTMVSFCHRKERGCQQWTDSAIASCCCECVWSLPLFETPVLLCCAYLLMVYVEIFWINHWCRHDGILLLWHRQILAQGQSELVPTLLEMQREEDERVRLCSLPHTISYSITLCHRPTDGWNIHWLNVVWVRCCGGWRPLRVRIGNDGDRVSSPARHVLHYYHLYSLTPYIRLYSM